MSIPFNSVINDWKVWKCENEYLVCRIQLLLLVPHQKRSSPKTRGSQPGCETTKRSEFLMIERETPSFIELPLRSAPRHVSITFTEKETFPKSPKKVVQEGDHATKLRFVRLKLQIKQGDSCARCSPCAASSATGVRNKVRFLQHKFPNALFLLRVKWGGGREGETGVFSWVFYPSSVGKQKSCRSSPVTRVTNLLCCDLKTTGQPTNRERGGGREKGGETIVLREKKTETKLFACSSRQDETREIKLAK